LCGGGEIDVGFEPGEQDGFEQTHKKWLILIVPGELDCGGSFQILRGEGCSAFGAAEFGQANQ